jgi:hypothetical protein
MRLTIPYAEYKKQLDAIGEMVCPAFNAMKDFHVRNSKKEFKDMPESLRKAMFKARTALSVALSEYNKEFFAK